MLLRLARTFAVGAIATLLSGGAALAITLPNASSAVPPAETAAPVEQVHGCHPGIQRDYHGWHFHGRSCVRRNVAPPGLYDGQTYRRFHRGPVCTYQCKFVGPVKTCSQVCR